MALRHWILILSAVLAVTPLLAAQTASQLNPAATENARLHETESPAASPVASRPECPPVPLSSMQRGDILMARKMYREAIETYREGIRSVAVLYNKIGIAYHQLLDFKAAMENYQMALRLDPTYAEAINNIGTIFYAQRKHKKAINQYKRALRLAPKSASIYSNLGTAYFARKKYKDAFEAYQKAIELDPNVFEHRSTAGSLLQERSVEERAKFHFYLAKTFARAGMLDRALLYMRKALEEGFRNRDRFRTDPDFKALQGNEEFERLLAMEPRVL